MKITAMVAAAAAVTLSLTALPAAAEDPAADTSAPLYYSYDLTSAQWWLDAVGAKQAHASGYTGEGVTVAVIDTGIDATHPDLAGRVLSGVDVSTGEEIEVSGEEDSDFYGHGTHVAGIIGAADNGHGITGIAPGVEFLPVLPLGPWSGDEGTIAAAVDWAANTGADVINMSLGAWTRNVSLTSDSEMCAAVNRAVEAGVTVVVSAGNDGEFGNPLSTPAGCPGAISVSAINSAGNPSWFSSFDPSVAVSAPGEEVFSTVPVAMLNTGYADLSGTSMAAPVVTGVAALLKQQDPTRTPGDIAEIIKQTATDLGRPGFDPRYGHGLVSAPAALGLSDQPQEWLPVPHLASYYDNDAGTSVVVSWKLPGTLPVDYYTVENFLTGDVLATADADQVRVELPWGGKDSMHVRVIAHFPTGAQSASSPWLVTSERYTDGGDGGDTWYPAILDVEGKWTKDGLRVKVQRNPAEVSEDVALTLDVDWAYLPANMTVSERVERGREITIPAGKSSVLLRVGKRSMLRELPLVLSQYSEEDYFDWGIYTLVAPQRPVGVVVKRLNAEQVLVTGGVWRCPTNDGAVSEELCEGRIVSAVDPKGRTLRRDIIQLGSRGGTSTFAIVVTRPSKRIAVTLGGYTSRLYAVPPKELVGS